MKKFSMFTALILCLVLSACGSKVDPSDNPIVKETPVVEESQHQVEDTPEPDLEALYFDGDEVVNKFFSDYNDLAEITIPQNEIEKGNIKTKALVYIDDLSMEIIHADDSLSVSMSSSAENESTKLYTLFRDTIKTMDTDISENDIQSTWDEIHKSGNLVENYDFRGVTITYVPSKELSWGTSDLRIDLKFSLN